MWQAKILKKSIKEGRFYVTIEYSNGQDKFQENYSTDQAQGVDWITNTVNQRIQKLTGVYSLHESIVVGPIEITPVEADPIEEEIIP